MNKRLTSPGKSYQAWIMSVASRKLVGSGSGLLAVMEAWPAGGGERTRCGRAPLWLGTMETLPPAGIWEVAQPGNRMPRVSSA